MVIIMAVVVMMIMMLRIWEIIVVIATVIIMKSKMIKMTMMIIIVITMIRQWMLELHCIYPWKVFRFKHFASFFWNLEFEWQSMRFSKKNRFLKIYQSISKATLPYWKEVTGQYWDKILLWVIRVCYNYWWMVVTFEWVLSNFLKLFTICSHRSLLKILLVSHNALFLVQWYLWSHEFHGFLLSEYGCKRKKFRLRSLDGHGYVSLNVTQQNLFVKFVIFFQRYLLASQPKFVEGVLKKCWKNLVNFAILYCILWFVTHVTKSAHCSLSSPFSVFPFLCISKWGNDIP